MFQSSTLQYNKNFQLWLKFILTNQWYFCYYDREFKTLLQSSQRLKLLSSSLDIPIANPQPLITAFINDKYF